MKSRYFLPVSQKALTEQLVLVFWKNLFFFYSEALLNNSKISNRNVYVDPMCMYKKKVVYKFASEHVRYGSAVTRPETEY